MNNGTLVAERGIAYTFYSFKGGVGRSMALANVGALLAKWGRRVLLLDWDLEAPGLEKFFAKRAPEVTVLRDERPGVVDLILSHADGNPIDWREAVIELPIGSNGARVSLISAGRSGEDYSSRLHRIDFERLFAENDLGAYVEDLRNQWLNEYEFVLVDSRTGVTDIGGICTVQLADVLVLLFTTTDSSVDGAAHIIEQARKHQQRLPVDRQRLLALPVPARDESRTEYERAAEWKRRFAIAFKELYADWLPSGKSASDAIEKLRIPYVPYWSFGETLPAIEEGATDPGSLGHAYELLGRLLVERLDWDKAFEGESLPPPERVVPRTLNLAWIGQRIQSKAAGIAPGVGRMEIVHGPRIVVGEFNQQQLLNAAKIAADKNHLRSLGAVLPNAQYKPKPKADGIEAEIRTDDSYDYWAIHSGGDFYAISAFSEDLAPNRNLLLNLRISCAAEAIAHCARLYEALGVEGYCIIELQIHYSGLSKRTLEAHGDLATNHAEATEDRVSASVTFQLRNWQSELLKLVKALCDPLFILFDFTVVDDSTYRKLLPYFSSVKL